MGNSQYQHIFLKRPALELDRVEMTKNAEKSDSHKNKLPHNAVSKLGPVKQAIFTSP